MKVQHLADLQGGREQDIRLVLKSTYTMIQPWPSDDDVLNQQRTNVLHSVSMNAIFKQALEALAQMYWDNFQFSATLQSGN